MPSTCMTKLEVEPELTEHVEDKILGNAVLAGADLLEIFMNEFPTGKWGQDRSTAMIKFLFSHGHNSNPDVLDD